MMNGRGYLSRAVVGSLKSLFYSRLISVCTKRGKQLHCSTNQQHFYTLRNCLLPYDHELSRHQRSFSAVVRSVFVVDSGCDRRNVAFTLSPNSHSLYRQLYTTQHLSRNNRNNDENDEHETDLDIDDDFLRDPRYSELFTETYLQPVEGHRIIAIQPDIKTLIGSAKSKSTTATLQLDELCALVETLPNWTVIDRAIHSLKHVDKRQLFGKGKLVEISEHVRRSNCTTAVVVGVDMLNSIQLSALQNSLGVAVYDRYTVVLQIFRSRARTKEAKLQVALAEIPYLRSRLRGMHEGTLDQQKGGMKYVGGSGETFLEVRQRLLHEREVKLRQAITKLRAQRELLRKQRRKNEFPIVAVVGYTNAGKTSLIKALTGKVSLQPRDQLFATLDVTMHAGQLPNHLNVLYVDTIGFISDIPTTLVESFAATLEDIATADVLVHVRDISHPDTVAQQLNVIKTLREQKLPATLVDNMINVCNKVDLLTDNDAVSCDTCLMVSVKTGLGLAKLQEEIQSAVTMTTGRTVRRLRIPMNGPHLSWLYKEATIESCSADASDTEKLVVNVVMTEASYAKFLSAFGQNKLKK